MEAERGPMIPHSDFGDPDCCGCLFGVVDGDQANIVCNECHAIVRTVPAVDLERTLNDMELQGDVASAICPHCGAVNLLPGFPQMLAFVCEECGEGVELADDSQA